MSGRPRTFEGLPVFSFATQARWEEWLAKNGAAAPGLWLRIAKKDAAAATVTYAEALESALCHGWIDGKKQALDGESWLQRFTPRRPKSTWSKRNREKAEELVASGRMAPPGLRAVEEAKRDGRWDAAYDSQRGAEAPAGFLAALGKSPRAARFYRTLSSANRYAILFRLQAAKTGQARARRVTQFVEMLERGETFHPAAER
jgi:uncharacterized protein YdeI (YjbR/CyaY-like superfamily)